MRIPLFIILSIFYAAVLFSGCSKQAVRPADSKVPVPGPAAKVPSKPVDKKTDRADKPDKVLSNKDRPYAVDGRWYSDDVTPNTADTFSKMTPSTKTMLGSTHLKMISCGNGSGRSDVPGQ